MSKLMEAHPWRIEPLNAHTKRLAERYFIIAGFSVLLSSLMVPNLGLTGAMVTALCTMIPMVQTLWSNQRTSGLVMALIGVVGLAPAIYALSRLLAFLAAELL